MLNITKKLPLIATLATSGLLVACGGGGGATAEVASTTHGTLRVALTDAPACGFDAVNVTVSKVRVHQSATAGETEAGWTDITLSPAKKINLLNLTNGILDELGKVSLPAGKYTQIRLVLEGNSGSTIANSVVPTGSTTEVALDTPSAARSGIKLINEINVEGDQQTDLVLDFDACKSVVTKGNGGYALKPVIKIVPASLNGIEGYINKAVIGANVMVTAQQGGAIVSATAPDATSGRFLLSRLPVGDYDVVITADNRATTVVAKVPVASTTATVLLSTSAAPIDLQAATTPTRNISGKLTLNPAATTDEVPYVAAKQGFSGGSVTVKFRGVDVATGAYSLDNLPTVAPMLGQYSSTLPITFSAQTSVTPGVGKYNVEYSMTGYQTQSATVDVSTANTTKDVILVK